MIMTGDSSLVQAGVLVAMTIINVASTFALKHGATTPDPVFVCLGAAGYCVGAVAFVFLLQSEPLVVLGPLSAVGQLLLVLIVARAQGEALSTMQAVAGGLACLSVSIAAIPMKA